jgi:hypothetical protein
MQGNEQLWAFSCEVVRELRVVKIEQACAESFGFTVYDSEYFHFLSLRKADEAHKGQVDVQVVEVTKPMLTVHLRKDAASGFIDRKDTLSLSTIDHLPTIGVRSQIESQWDRGASGLLDVASKVEAVLWIEAALVSTTRQFIQDVSKTQFVQQVSWREAQQHR